MSFNVNGIRAAHRKGFGDLLDTKQPDIICLQEVKANEEDIPKLSDSYTWHWHTAKRKGYSGVGIGMKQKASIILKGIGIDKYDREGRVIRADINGLSIISVYVPSGSSGDIRLSYKMQFLKAFRRYIRELLAEKRELIVCGDINIAHKPIDLTNWRSNQKTSGFLPEERKWLDRFLKLGMVDSYRQHIGEVPSYSWWSLRTGARARNVGWRLDYQLTTPKLAAQTVDAEIPIEPNLSDHAPVIMDYEVLE